ncbi:MAG: MIP/aquaporin family protein [Moorellaceae bacterium]
MDAYLAELVGTMLLIVFGDGVVANVLLRKSKAENSGWIVIITGWAIGVMAGVYLAGRISGGHLNPAVTIALASIGVFPWNRVPGYIVAQMIGAFIGACLVWLHFLPHWSETENKAAKLAIFCTGPAIRNYPCNLLSEIIATFVLVVGVLAIGANKLTEGLSPLLVALLVWGIGAAHGGPTGYAINPARDLGPRIAHFVLPIAGKGDSDWGYAWIPVVGPIIGGVLGALFYVSVFGG